MRATVDAAASQLAIAEASGRYAWRTLLGLDVRGEALLYDVLAEAGLDLEFPQTPDAVAQEAVEIFARDVESLQLLATRLELRFGDTHPAAKSFESAREHLALTATTMAVGAAGLVGLGGTDLEDTIDAFLKGVADRRDFVAKARSLIV